MTISSNGTSGGAGQAERAVETLQAAGPLSGSGAAANPVSAKPPAYGSTPSAVISLSVQAKVAQAKAYAIKHGHDPDGVQDGK